MWHMKTKYELNDEVVDDNQESYRYRPLWGQWGNPFMYNYNWPAGYGISPAYYPPRRRFWGRRRYRPSYW